MDARTLVSESDDPHVFSPTPKQIADLSNAAFLFTGVMPFEEELVHTLADGNTKVKVHSLTDGVELLEGSCELCAEHSDDDEPFVYVKGEDDAEGEHDEEEHHHHEHELDPHVWLSPEILKLQATKIATVLKELLSEEDGKAIDQNLAKVAADLDSLDAHLAGKLKPLNGQTFYVYHGAFAYFAQNYGLQQEAIEVGGKRPEPKRLAELVEQAKEDGVKLIFVQPQFDQTSAKTLAESIGGDVVELDPLEQNVFANLEKIADTVLQ